MEMYLSALGKRSLCSFLGFVSPIIKTDINNVNKKMYRRRFY